MIRLTTSASTIESLIIRNTLTLKSIELSPWSTIVRVSIVTSRFHQFTCRFLLGNDCYRLVLYLRDSQLRTSDLSI
ncbi:hypothetical protein TNCV_2501361 [Trichonephila clavipes]|nr:hypothetical protein TNCV_2501361 [Trichonephila clavipes]